MLHPREFTFGAGGIGLAKIIRNYQTQDGVTKKFQSFIMELTSLVFRAGRHLFVGPGTMRDRTLQQGTVLELVNKNGFQEVEIRSCNPLFLQGRFDCNKAGSVVKLMRQSFRL